jgi:CBS domain-containing protein
MNEPVELFKDPLSTYDPPDYRDPLERALAEEPVESITSHPIRMVPPKMPIADAVGILRNEGFSCLIVADDGHLLGLFTVRDVLDKVADRYEHIKHDPIGDVMTSDPVFVYDTDSAGATMCVMAVSGFRHVPVLNTDGKVTGIVSPKRIVDFLQEYDAE